MGHVVSEKVDIWALGVILFKLAFFQTPFEDNKGTVEPTAILKGFGDVKVRRRGMKVDRDMSKVGSATKSRLRMLHQFESRTASQMPRRGFNGRRWRWWLYRGCIRGDMKRN